MFANKSTRDVREAKAADEWRKAKKSLRASGRVLFWLFLIAAAVFIYFSGERAGFLACRSNKPEVTSTQ